MVFKNLKGKMIDLDKYALQYMKEHPNDQILVGCDSQVIGKKTVFAVVVAFYNYGHGGHIIFKKWKDDIIKTRQERLLIEVWKSIEVAEELRKNGFEATYIDIDINPDPKYKSNEVLRQAVGMCEGMGYHVRYKHTAPLVTTMADYIARGCVV